MHSHDPASKNLAIWLAALAGYVDALGFISLGGFFVSFMSGNSTRFAVGLSGNIPWVQALIPLGLIALFVVGVMLGRCIRHFSPAEPSTAVLMLMSGALTAAALASEFHLHALAAPLMAIAMGAANNVFVREGKVSIGVTYMTGTLVKLGQHLAERLLGERDSDWLPYLLLWAGLVAGAVFGAIGYGWWDLRALWGAVLLCLTLAFSASRTAIRRIKE